MLVIFVPLSGNQLIFNGRMRNRKDKKGHSYKNNQHFKRCTHFPVTLNKIIKD